MPASQPLNTIVIVNDAAVARGGATGLAVEEARLMRGRGLRVVFVCGDAGDAPDLVAAGVDMRSLGGTALMRAPAVQAATRGMFNPAARAHLATVVAECDGPGTVYHIHGFTKVLTAAILPALHPVRARTFLHAHDYFLACPNGGYMDYRAGQPCPRRPLSMPCLTRNCDKRSYAQKLWRVGRQAVLWRALGRDADWGGIFLIHPAMAGGMLRAGIAARLLHPLRNPALPFASTRIRAEDNRGFAFVGRLQPEKGIEDLIAAARLADQPLVVIGDGPLRARLARENPGTRFTGWLDRAAIGRELAGVRALVMPSRYPEPFGLVAAEAALSGLPVILPHTALLAQDIAACNLGVVCDTRDPATLAGALQDIADAAPEKIAETSLRGHSGRDGIALTPDGWIDALLARFAQAVGA